MNITLSVDERLIRQAREKAHAPWGRVSTSSFASIERLAGSDDAERDVAELRQLSRESRGCARGWRFNRDDLHERA